MRYRTVKYLRLSEQDGDERESESIENQRDLIESYIGKHEDLEDIGEYIDDGFTGGNFDRPQFKQTMDLQKRY